MVTSQVEILNGIPRLVINGKPVPPLAYMTYLTDRACYADFAASGYRLFSFPVFFGFNRLNQHSGLDVFKKGIFDGSDPDYSVFDRDVEAILSNCPDAFIFPRVNVNPSEYYERENPDECCSCGRICIASDKWASDVKAQLTGLVRHVESSPYAHRIAGYQIAGGNTEEWLPLEPQGLSGRRAYEKFAEYYPGKSPEEDPALFHRFYSLITAELVCGLAAHVKALTRRRLVVGSFYGYTFECPHPPFPHHALRQMLSSPDIDFICSPISYSNLRAPGRDHPYMVPFASVRHHGKLYFTENDTRTHLSRPVNSMPHYNGPIWYGPDSETTEQIMLLHAAKDIVNAHGGWWFDMWGGWYSHQPYMKLAEKLLATAKESLDLPCKSLAQIAVFADEEVLCRADSSANAGEVVFGIREAIGKLGAPVDYYLTGDMEAAVGYSAVISLIPAESQNSKKLKDLCREKNIPLLEIRRENSGITPDELRAFARRANVHIWCERDCVVYANESFLFLHTAGEGSFTVTDPEGAELWDVISDRPFSSRFTSKAGRSCLLRRYPNKVTK